MLLLPMPYGAKQACCLCREKLEEKCTALGNRDGEQENEPQIFCGKSLRNGKTVYFSLYNLAFLFACIIFFLNNKISSPTVWYAHCLGDSEGCHQ